MPALSFTTAACVLLSPTIIVTSEFLKEMEFGLFATTTFTDARTPLVVVAIIVALPDPSAVTSPTPFTVAIRALELSQMIASVVLAGAMA
jgi:hypothetical protein